MRAHMHIHAHAHAHAHVNMYVHAHARMLHVHRGCEERADEVGGGRRLVHTYLVHISDARRGERAALARVAVQ